MTPELILMEKKGKKKKELMSLYVQLKNNNMFGGTHLMCVIRFACTK